MFFSYMLIFFEKRFVSNRFICFACLMLFSHFVLSSRGSYFPYLYEFVKLFLFYKVVFLFMKSFVSKGSLLISKINNK
jgi:hypothetical protein